MCIWVGVVAFNCINQSLWRWYKLWKGNNRGRQFCGDQINVLCSHHLHLQPWKPWLCGYSLLSAGMQPYLMMLNSILTACAFITKGWFGWHSDYPSNCRKYYSKHHKLWLTSSMFECWYVSFRIIMTNFVNRNWF